MTYTVVFVREQDGRYSVSVPALPGCHTWGESLPHAVRMVEEAMQCHLECLQAHGEPMPPDVDSVTFGWEEGRQEAVVRRVAVPEAAQLAQATRR